MVGFLSLAYLSFLLSLLSFVFFCFPSLHQTEDRESMGKATKEGWVDY